jgi:hypothetical protein
MTFTFIVGVLIIFRGPEAHHVSFRKAPLGQAATI